MEYVDQVPDLSSLSRIAAYLATDQRSLSVDEDCITTVCRCNTRGEHDATVAT